MPYTHHLNDFLIYWTWPWALNPNVVDFGNTELLQISEIKSSLVFTDFTALVIVSIMIFVLSLFSSFWHHFNNPKPLSRRRWISLAVIASALNLSRSFRVGVGFFAIFSRALQVRRRDFLHRDSARCIASYVFLSYCLRIFKWKHREYISSALTYT